MIVKPEAFMCNDHAQCAFRTRYVTGIEHQRNDQTMDEQQVMRGAERKHDVGNKVENVKQELEWRKLQIQYNSIKAGIVACALNAYAHRA